MRVSFVFFVGLIGCGSVVDPGPMASGSGTSSGAPASSTSETPTSTGNVPTTTLVPTSSGDDSSSTGGLDTGSSGGDSASSGSTGSDPQDSVCNPQPTRASPLLQLNEAPFFDIDHLEFEGTCTVAAVSEESEVRVFDFECGKDSFRLSMGYLYPANLQPGDTVELSLFVDSPWWGNGYVKVMRDGVLELAAMEGEALPGDDPSLPPADFFAPLSVELQSDVCDVEPVWDGSFIGKPCTRDRRLGLSFTAEDATATVLDFNWGSFGAFDVSVGRTRNYVEVYCTDTPNGWREFAVVRAPE